METLEDNGLDKILEVLKPRKMTSEDKILCSGTIRGQSAQFSNEKCEGAVKRVKEHHRGLRQMMADGDSSVARASESSGCNVR